MNFFGTQKYNQHEVFCKEAFRWEMDFNKLSCNKFFGTINLIDIEDLQIGRIKLNGKMEQKGLNPIGFRTVVIPADNFQSFSWLKVPVSERDVLIFPKSGDLDAVSFSNFYYYMISIKEELLNEIIEIYNFSNLDKMLKSDEVVFRLKQDYFTYIQNYLHQQFSLLNQSPSLINTPSFLYKLRYKLTYLIFSFLDTTNYSKVKIAFRKRDVALFKCMKYISSKKNQKVTVSNLVEVSNMSERTLQLAFLEKYGVSPKEYIKYLKLNDVRGKLINHTSSKGVISEIAKESGFTHLGQFSAAYKKLFNELPKDTLRR